MSAGVFGAALLGVYCLITIALSVVGMKKTSDLKSFAIGKGDMSPTLVGLTMASSIASTATFVINPGFVYADGLSAYLHYGVAAMGGLAVALVVMSKSFHRIGSQVAAVTLPDWLKKRFGSQRLGVGFALLSLLYITFIVLILAGSAIILGGLFGLDYHLALVGVLLFVFSYVLMGGSYAHAYTNAFQSVMMLVIAVGLFAVGVWRIDGSFMVQMQDVSASFASVFNEQSALYNGPFSVFISAFVVTAALMMQPHILTKVLYLKEEKDLRTFLVVTIVCSVLFSLMLFIGFFARFSGLEVPAQDKVVVVWITQNFSPVIVSFVLVTLLAAGMSTLDGILVSLSTVVVADLVLPFSPADKEGNGLWYSRIALVVIGLVSLALAWNPPALLGIFAQQGVYGLVAASFAPFFLGTLFPQVKSAVPVAWLAVVGVATHGVLQVAGVENPAVSAAWGILVSGALAFVVAKTVRAPAASMTP